MLLCILSGMAYLSQCLGLTPPLHLSHTHSPSPKVALVPTAKMESLGFQDEQERRVSPG